MSNLKPTIYIRQVANGFEVREEGADYRFGVEAAQ